jgi:hypothetical protein
MLWFPFQFSATDSLLPASLCHQLPEFATGAQPQLLIIHPRNADNDCDRLIILGDAIPAHAHLAPYDLIILQIGSK